MMGLGYVDQQAVPRSNGVFLTSKRTSLPHIETACDSDAWTAALIQVLASHFNEKVSAESLSPLHALALSVVRQSLVDAEAGDYGALKWLITEGREWLDEMGISLWIVDVWGCELP